MAQIIESRGSTPRHSGQMLILNDGAVIGSIGGGMMERRVIEEALQAIEQRQDRMFNGRMTRDGHNAVGSDCGGAMSVFISVHGLRPRLLLLGGGHVNQAIAYAAAPLEFAISVVDVYAPNLEAPRFPTGVDLFHAAHYAEAIKQLNPDEHCYVIIATNSQDREVLDALLPYPVKYLGLLASRRKVQTFVRHWQQQGVPEEQWLRLRAPIGLDIGAETPAEIAVSVLAEILQLKNGADGQAMNQITTSPSAKPITA
ncbi:XdhC family protein [Serratia rhizosphaerae]|nr:XdhC family protein [Serratia rhizosphaerae]